MTTPNQDLVDNVWQHSLNAKLDYAVDLNDPDDPWLAAGETINGTPTVTGSDATVIVSNVGVVGGTKIVAWAKCTELGWKRLTFSWVTTAGREDSRRIVLDVVSGR